MSGTCLAGHGQTTSTGYIPPEASVRSQVLYPERNDEMHHSEVVKRISDDCFPFLRKHAQHTRIA